MYRIITCIFLLLLSHNIFASSTISKNTVPKVVVSIKPIHSLVAAVMAGVGKPTLMIQGNETPHSFRLSPRKAKKLQNADLFFWIGKELETMLARPIRTLANKAKVVSLIKTKGLELLEFREEWSSLEELHKPHNEHHEHSNKQHSKHEHDDNHQEEHHKHQSDRHQGHNHGTLDPHIWLDPLNAIKLLEEIAKQLSQIDSKNQLRYQQNAQSQIKEIEQLHQQLLSKTKKFNSKSFLVFHDSYQYFEKRYQLNAMGSIIFNPESPSSAKRLRSIQKVIKNKQISCIFSEPQFSPKLVKTVVRGTKVKGTKVRTGVLDPLGINYKAGENLYIVLLNNLSSSLHQCLH